MRALRVMVVGLDEDDRPLLVLQESGGRRRVLPVWVGAAEATAIAAEQQRLEQRRPLSHALIARVVIACGRHVRQVSITELRGNVFYAELVLDRETRVSARVSDAVAIALHLGVPIRVDDAVLDQAGLDHIDLYTVDSPTGRVPGSTGGVGRFEEREVQRLREFLDTASPDDFDPS